MFVLAQWKDIDFKGSKPYTLVCQQARHCWTSYLPYIARTGAQLSGSVAVSGLLGHTLVNNGTVRLQSGNTTLIVRHTDLIPAIVIKAIHVGRVAPVVSGRQRPCQPDCQAGSLPGDPFDVQ
jgi:hypothetical protein